MVMHDTRAARAASFAVTVLTLVVIAAMLTGLLLWLLNSAGTRQGDEPIHKERQKVLVRMAALVTAALVLNVLVLLYLVARYVARRVMASSAKHTPTPYVNAWVEAGRRLRAEDAPPVPGFEEEDDEQDEDEQQEEEDRPDDNYPGQDR